MYSIVKLVKTEWRQQGAGSHHTSRSEDWTLTWMSSHSNLSEAEMNLRNLTTTDPDPASEWHKRKVYSEITYEQYLANSNNYHHRKYFLITPEYTVADLEMELRGCLKKMGIGVM